MRFIIHELDYEKPLAAGRLRYEQDGRPAGAEELWRWTEAVNGYRFLRVDLDARQATSGESTLYHLTLNPAGRPERLKFRFFGPETRVTGDVLLDGPMVSLSRDVNGQRLETVAKWPAGMLFWFPSTAALGLLVRAAGGRPAFPALTLDRSAAFVLRPVEVYLAAGQEEVLAVARQRVVARPFSIRWDDQERTVWLDEYGWPVKMVRGDGLAAVETRYVRYQPAGENKQQRIDAN